MRINSKWMVAVSMLALVGCRGEKDTYKPQPVQEITPVAISEGVDKTLLPLKKGNQWTYTVDVLTMKDGKRAKSNPIELTWKVTDLKQAGAGTIATIEEFQGTSLRGRQVWLLNDKGLYQMSTGLNAKAFNPPQPVVLFPVQADKQFTWKGTGPTVLGAASKISSENKILGSQEVDTDIGRLSAIPIESSTAITGVKKQGKSASTVWLVPNTGIVRYRQETVSGTTGTVVLLKLKSKSLVQGK